MRVFTRALLLTALLTVWDWGLPVDLFRPVAPADAQPNPPSTWHPYQGGVNCIQVADKDGNFNCSATATIDPVTGAVSIPALAPGTGTFLKSVAIVPSTTATTPQLLGSGDLVLSTSPNTIAPAGPRIRGVTLRVRQASNGTCQLVVAAGDGFTEFVIPVLQSASPNAPGPGVVIGQFLEWFPGGNLGC